MGRRYSRKRGSRSARLMEHLDRGKDLETFSTRTRAPPGAGPRGAGPRARGAARGGPAGARGRPRSLLPRTRFRRRDRQRRGTFSRAGRRETSPLPRLPDAGFPVLARGMGCPRGDPLPRHSGGDVPARKSEFKSRYAQLFRWAAERRKDAKAQSYCMYTLVAAFCAATASGPVPDRFPAPRRPGGDRRHPAQRHPVLHPGQSPPRKAGRTSARGQCRLGAGGQGPAGSGPFRRAHGVQRDHPLQKAGTGQLHRIDRDAIRRRPQRRHLASTRPSTSCRFPPTARTSCGKAFEILEDWAHGVTFDTTEIRKERGVVLEEWRLGRGAGQRMFDKQLPVLFKGSRYAERLPIGTPGMHLRPVPPRRCPDSTRLVSTRSDGGGRGRRLRPGGDRELIKSASRASRSRRPGAAPFDGAAAPDTRSHHRHRPGSDSTSVSVYVLRPAARAGPSVPGATSWSRSWRRRFSISGSTS